MAQTIKLKRSAVAAKVPLTTDIALGELAINTYDGKMYFKKAVGASESIIQLANDNEVVKLAGDQVLTGSKQVRGASFQFIPANGVLGQYVYIDSTGVFAANNASLWVSKTPVDNEDVINLSYLNTQLATKANDSAVVKLTGNQTIAGVKTFSSDGYFNGVRVGRGAGNSALNVVLGPSTAFANNTSGTYCIAIGEYALGNNTSGVYNTAIGAGAAANLTTGSYNFHSGSNSGLFGTSASNNVGIGVGTLVWNTTGVDNIGIGNNSVNSTTSSANCGVGSGSLLSSTSGYGNVAIGSYAADRSTTGSFNSFIGVAAGRFQSNGATDLTDPEGCVYIGAECRGKDNSDSNSVVIAGRTATARGVGDGANTTVIGNAETTSTRIPAGTFTVTGGDGFFNGVRVGKGSNSVTGNICIGTNFPSVSGNNNIAIGTESGLNATTGSLNIGVGINTNRLTTTGNYNSSFGPGALQSNTTGSANIAIGWAAATHIANGSTILTDPEGCVYIGNFVRGNSNADSNSIVIAGYTATATGVGDGANTTVIGNAETTSTRLEGSLRRNAPVTKTANFTLGDRENWVINNKSGSSCTVTLPAASSWTGREVMFKNIQAQTLVSASSNVVPRAGGAAGTAILAATAGAWATLVSDGTNWIIMQGS